jgi:plastocyanin
MISHFIILGIIATFSIGADYAFAEFESTEPIITVQMNGPSTFYLDQSNQIIRATVEIQNYTPSDGIYFMKVTHLPTQRVMKNSDIYPSSSGNSLWSVQIAYPFLESDIKIANQAFLGEFEIHIRTEFGSQTASTTFSIFEYTYGPESKLVPSETSTSLDLISVNIPAETSEPGCEIIKKCYIPNEVTIDVGYTIEWVNYDPEAHTVTSKTLDGGPSGEFDSGLLSYGKKFSHTFDKSGEFYYFCTIHPWMNGFVIVEELTPQSILAILELVRENAEWWAQGAIGDSDFVSEIQYLIKKGIMTIPETVQSTTGDDSQEIPSWIKNNAEWWAQGLITDDDFVEGIQYLVENGIIHI